MKLKKAIGVAAISAAILLATTGCQNGTETPPHTHTFDTATWESDGTHHWHKATCEHTDEKDGMEAHKWNDGKVTKEATLDAEGEKTLSCTVCQATKAEKIPTRTVQSVVDEGGAIDLKNRSVTESLEVNKAATIKNAELNGKTVTVNAADSVIENISNATVIVSAKVGEGDFTIKSSKGITLLVEGGGENSIHIEDVKIAAMTIAKEAVRVVLKGATEVQQAVVTAKKARVESTGESAKIEVLEIGKDAQKIEVSGGKIATLKVTFAEGESKKSAVSLTNGTNVEKAEAVTEKGEAAPEATIVITATEDVKTPENVQTEAPKDPENPENPEEHKHTFDAEKWEGDDTHHWHPATCEHAEEVDGKAEHKWDKGEVTKEATCAAKGERTFTCTVCKATKTEEIEKTDSHKWDEGKVTTEPTEEKEGVKTYTCAVCKETKTEKVDKLPHTHKFDTTKWESNDTHHWHKATCEHTDEPGDKAEHDWETNVTTEPTEEKEGEKTLTCKICGKTKTEKVEKLEHTHKFDAKKWDSDDTHHWHPATCEHTDESDGKAEHKFEKQANGKFKCSVCEKEIDALNVSCTISFVSGDIELVKVEDMVFTATLDGVKDFTWYFNDKELPVKTNVCDIRESLSSVLKGAFELIVIAQKDGITLSSTYNVVIEY